MGGISNFGWRVDRVTRRDFMPGAAVGRAVRTGRLDLVASSGWEAPCGWASVATRGVRLDLLAAAGFGAAAG
jgi:hypothetical protein